MSLITTSSAPWPDAGVLSRLAQWACALDTQSIPDPVRLIAHRCVLDTLGVAIAGRNQHAAQVVTQSVVPFSGHGHCQILTAGSLADPGQAALINATCAHALDFDDNSYAGFVHGSAVIIPAALAVAQHVDASGARLLDAVILASEIQYSLGECLGMPVYERGWWTTGLLGAAGAAAAAALLLDLPAQRVHAALALALVSGGVTKAVFGSDAKPLGAGRASQQGVIAALLARSGASAPEQVFQGPYGWVNLLNDGQFSPERLHDLGQRWRMLSPGVDVKRIPVCLSSHAAVDCIEQLVLENGLRASEVDSVVCDVPPVVVHNLVFSHPKSRQQAQFSMHYAIAVTLVDGPFTLAHLDPCRMEDPAIIAMMARIDMVCGPQWRDAKHLKAYPEGAEVIVTTRSGHRCRAFRGRARGCAADPMSDQELHEKFIVCAAPALGESIARDFADLIRSIDQTNSVRMLLPLPTHNGIN